MVTANINITLFW